MRRIALQKNREIAILATFVHGALAALHLLGVVYNVKRKNKWDVAAHTAAMFYDGYSTYKHVQEVRNGFNPYTLP